VRVFRVASRRSALALQQTHWVINELKSKHPDIEFEVVPVMTKGDQILDVTLSKVGGKGLFVSEIEATILNGQADLAVHSLKDVPAELAPGLSLTAFPLRADARDAWISKSGQHFAEMPSGARVGTSSLRRVAQLAERRPDLEYTSVRGNIDSRLRKLQDGDYDAIVLAAAGLHRMDWADQITEYLHPDVCLPAVGQGVLGIESRLDDIELVELLQSLTHHGTKIAASAERSLLQRLNGSCKVPIAGYATFVDGSERLELRGLVARPDGRKVIRAVATGVDASDVAQRVANQLIADGALELLREFGDER